MTEKGIEKLIKEKSYLTDEEFEICKELLKQKSEIEETKEYYQIFKKDLDKKVENLLEEDWKEVPLKDLKEIIDSYSKENSIGKKYHEISKIEVSKYGNIKINGRIMDLEDNHKYGYLRIVNYPGLGYVYELCALAYLGEKPNDDCEYHIHHINNNGYENTKENLIYLKYCQHKYVHPFMKDCPKRSELCPD